MKKLFFLILLSTALQAQQQFRSSIIAYPNAKSIGIPLYPWDTLYLKGPARFYNAIGNEVVEIGSNVHSTPGNNAGMIVKQGMIVDTNNTGMSILGVTLNGAAIVGKTATGGTGLAGYFDGDVIIKKLRTSNGTDTASTGSLDYDGSNLYYTVPSGKIVSVAVTPVNGGTGYRQNDVVLISDGSNNAIAHVTYVTAGVVTDLAFYEGFANTSGYTTGTHATTGGSGTGLTVNITAVDNTMTRFLLSSNAGVGMSASLATGFIKSSPGRIRLLVPGDTINIGALTGDSLGGGAQFVNWGTTALKGQVKGKVETDNELGLYANGMSGGSFSTGIAKTFKSAVTDSFEIAQLSSTQFAVAYINSATGFVEVVRLDTSGALIGTPIVISDTASSYVNIAKLTETKVAISYKGRSKVSNIAVVNLLTGDKSIYIHGAEAPVQEYWIAMTAMSDTALLCTYSLGSPDWHHEAYRVFIDDMTITAGATAIISEGDNPNYLSITKLTDTTAGCVYQLGTNTPLMTVILSASSITTTVGAGSSLELEASTRPSLIKVLALSSTKMFVVYASGGYARYAVVNVSGTVATLSSINSIGSSIAVFHITQSVVSSTQALVTYSVTTTGETYSRYVDFIGSTVSVGAAQLLMTISGGIHTATGYISGGKFLLIYPAVTTKYGTAQSDFYVYSGSGGSTGNIVLSANNSEGIWFNDTTWYWGGYKNNYFYGRAQVHGTVTLDSNLAVGRSLTTGLPIDTTYTNSVSKLTSTNTFAVVGGGGKAKDVRIDTAKYATIAMTGFLKYLDYNTFNIGATRAGLLVADSAFWNTAYTRSGLLVADSGKWNAMKDSVWANLQYKEKSDTINDNGWVRNWKLGQYLPYRTFGTGANTDSLVQQALHPKWTDTVDNTGKVATQHQVDSMAATKFSIADSNTTKNPITLTYAVNTFAPIATPVFTGLATVDSLKVNGAFVIGSGSFSQGRGQIYNTVVDGTVISGKAGVTSDFAVLNSLGDTVFIVATGTQDVRFSGAIVLTTTRLNVGDGTNRNVGVGVSPMPNLSSGTDNSGFGWNPLDLLTTGSNNSGFGRHALSYVSTGSGNSAFGADAMGYGNGSYNTAIGQSAGHSRITMTGSSNTYIGYAAGRNIDDGSNNNIFIGAAAGEAYFGFAVMNDNIIIGGASVQQGGATYRNTIIGTESALTMSGNSNTFIGWHSAHNVTTGSRNIIIGSGIETDLTSATTNDELRIGNYLVGDLTNGNLTLGAVADTGTGLLYAGDVITASRPYAELFLADTANALTLTVQSGYYTIHKWNESGVYNNCTITDSTITVGRTGVYKLSGSITLAVNNNHEELHLVFFNGTTELTKSEIETEMATSGDHYVFSLRCLASLTANDVIKLKVKNVTSAGKVVTVVNGNWGLEKIN